MTLNRIKVIMELLRSDPARKWYEFHPDGIRKGPPQIHWDVDLNGVWNIAFGDRSFVHVWYVCLPIQKAPPMFVRYEQ